MESKKEANIGLISVDQVFSCQKCKKIAYQPFVTNCCEAILCNQCLRSLFKCPICDKVCKIRGSNILSSIYRNTIVQCQFRCGAKVLLSSMASHTPSCPEARKECPYCREMVRISAMPEHLGGKHQEECNRIILDFHKSSSNLKSEVGLAPSVNIEKIQPFKVGTVGNYNIEPRICLAGRLVCGRPLVQNRSSSVSASLFQPKQRDVCSLEYGSCDRCMDLDIDRLGLPPNHLLNLQGKICLFVQQKRIVACGCSNGNKTCNEQLQCTPCKRLLGMIERGFYKRSINQIQGR